MPGRICSVGVAWSRIAGLSTARPWRSLALFPEHKFPRGCSSRRSRPQIAPEDLRGETTFEKGFAHPILPVSHRYETLRGVGNFVALGGYYIRGAAIVGRPSRERRRATTRANSVAC
jgi:hypothetical protein